MKKLLAVLLAVLMTLSLTACKTNQNVEDVTIEEEVIQQVEEEIEEVVDGGWNKVEDGTITDELKEIFNSALKGLLGATYEPIELLETQVVAGTNYKFLAKGTKTTNPPIEGTYNIKINKDLDGNTSVLDIEVVEEKQIEKPVLDVTQTSFWIVFYDQYGNELQRTAEKYGTVPSFKGALPEGFEKWVYKKSQKDVDTFKPITTNTYFEAVCHAVHHGSSSPAPSSDCENYGKPLFYVFDQNIPTTGLVKYSYSGGTYNIDSVYYAPFAFLSFNIGDFVHDAGTSNYVKCEENGDGVTPPNIYTVTVNCAEHGSGNMSFIVPEGSNIVCDSSGNFAIRYNSPNNLQASEVLADSGFKFSYWHVDGEINSATKDLTITSDITVTAYFEPLT